jgi:hypothetical protein
VNPLVANQSVEALAEPVRLEGLSCEGPLRIAAGTLSRAVDGEISATTVVGVLGADDVQEFKALVGGIADEFGFDATVRLHVGSFSVRLSRHAPILAAVLDVVYIALIVAFFVIALAYTRACNGGIGAE